MDAIERKIIEQLAKTEKMKAKHIAKAINVIRREVNQYLYYKLNEVCVRDMFFQWSLKRPIESEEVQMIIDLMNKPQGPSPIRCENCMNFKGDKCNGLGHVCKEFKPAPHLSEEDLKMWAKEMDVSRIKRKLREHDEKYGKR